MTTAKTLSDIFTPHLCEQFQAKLKEGLTLQHAKQLTSSFQAIHQQYPKGYWNVYESEDTQAIVIAPLRFAKQMGLLINGQRRAVNNDDLKTDTSFIDRIVLSLLHDWFISSLSKRCQTTSAQLKQFTAKQIASSGTSWVENTKSLTVTHCVFTTLGQEVSILIGVGA